MFKVNDWHIQNRLEKQFRGTVQATRETTQYTIIKHLNQELSERNEVQLHFHWRSLGTSLSVQTKFLISNFLVEVRDIMNKDHKEGITKTFEETCWPDCTGVASLMQH